MQPETDFPVDLRALESSYELIRELGQGGMAAVYLARRRDTGRLVAIKAIRARYADDPDAIQRFAREARTVADLNHPNIVRTEAIEEIGDRAVAIVMEYVAGGTVRDRLREFGAFSAEHTEAVLRDVGNALGYAHQRGIVHRDVKPENVFLDERTGRALLSDFGIARRIEGDVPITMLGAALGTPQYMSPEQIDGSKVDGRSDIYSLGVLGWELLTGQRPWSGESLYGVIYKQKHEELPRITSLRPRVPANLLFAIEGALVKDRNRRWQTVEEFLQHLTYDAPPVLSQARYDPAVVVGDEPTMKFRRPTDAAAAAPNDPAPPPSAAEPVPRPAAPAVPATPAARPSPRARPMRRLPAALALIGLLAIAGGSWYVLLDGGTSRPSTTARADGVNSSAGTVALDSARLRDTTVVSKREPPKARETTRPAATPAPQPPVAAPPVAKPRPTPPRSGPSPRCARASMADQRACLMTYVAANDASLQAVYDSLIRQLRRSAQVPRGAPDPPAVRQLRAEQRSWVVTRDRACTREVVPGSVQLWAEPLAKCFARMSTARRDELAEALAGAGNRN